MPRPQRLRIHDELGAPRTLLESPDQFQFLPGNGRRLAILGVGPSPAAAVRALPGERQGAHAHVIESPAFLGQMEEAWHAALPEAWSLAGPGGVDPTSDLLLYRPAFRLFPSFWGPLLARVALARRPPAQETQQAAVIAIPGGENDLLQRELEDAAQRLGFSLAPPFTSVRDLLNACRPALFLSVNLRGMDPWGEDYHLLRAAGVAVALWCVDVPWHLVSKCKAAWWKDAPLFVTDHSFIPDLQAHGVEKVYHLPLAGWPEGFCAALPVDDSLQNRGLFVGRSAFPNRDRFFAGQHLPGDLQGQSLAMLEEGDRPDYWWWVRHLEITTRWPHAAIRQGGLGAAEASLAWRVRCVQQMQNAGPVTVVGDTAWQDLLPSDPDLQMCPPVDYYGPLPSLYRDAAYVCNATNLLLPAGCTQRHFDVWLAGGLLITDSHPGLDLFGKDLTRPITFHCAQDIPPLLGRLLSNPAEAAALGQAWRDSILTKHTYVHRLQTVLDNATSRMQ